MLQRKLPIVAAFPLANKMARHLGDADAQRGLSRSGNRKQRKVRMSHLNKVEM
jgi:hypothetical protein